MEGFDIGFVGADHIRGGLSGWARSFDLKKDGGAAVGPWSAMNDEICALHGGDEVIVAVEGTPEKVAEVAFRVFFRFFGVEVIEQATQMLFKALHVFTPYRLFPVGGIEGLGYGIDVKLHNKCLQYRKKEGNLEWARSGQGRIENGSLTSKADVV